MNRKSSRKLRPKEPSVVNEDVSTKAQADLPADPSRRSFLGKVGVAASVTMAAGAVTLEPLVGGKESVADAAVVGYKSGGRASASFNYRVKIATGDNIDVGVQPDNGDAALHADKSGSYSKVLLHDSLALPNLVARNSLIKALTTGNAADFENIINGTPGGAKHNNPQAALAFDTEGLDSHAYVVPPAPPFASAQTAAEEVEHYWAALLRDVNFTDYGSNSLVARAVADMNKLSYLKSPKNKEFPFPVTPQNLFRGQFVPGDGNVVGPYLSQFMCQPTFFGAQPVSQQFQVFSPAGGGGSDYMTSVNDYMTVANGGSTGLAINYDPTPRYLRNGRDLASWTHVDVLYEGYFVAFLLSAFMKAPLNPGNPYLGYTKTKGFATFGGPDFAAAIAEVATRALKAVWFHKWIVNMRQRPEEQGAVVHLILTNAAHPGTYPPVQATVDSDLLNSQALAQTFSKYGTYLLPQAFPEGSPTHPCYPTGHGTVGGACCTILKFFFDGSQKIRPLLQAVGTDVVQPSSNGLALENYVAATGDEAGANAMDINGELNKLAWNISVGHGIHAGIHYRSSTYRSILLGEQVALSILRDKAASYNEKFSVTITKFDGTTTTIKN